LQPDKIIDTIEADDDNQAAKSVEDDFNASISSDDMTLHDKLNKVNYHIKAK